MAHPSEQSGRALRVLLWTVGIAIVILLLSQFVVPELAALWMDGSGPDGEVKARLVAALGSLLGPVFAALGALGLWTLRHRADMEREVRQTARRQLKMLLALRAELILNLEAQAKQFLGASGQQRRDLFEREVRMAPRGKHSMPMSVVSDTNDAYDHIRPYLSDLPASVLPEVIGYYQNDEYVSQLLKSFSDGTFEKVTVARRERALAALFEIGRDAALAAFDAVEALNASIAQHSERAGFASKDLEIAPTQRDVLETVREDVAAARNAQHNSPEKSGSDDNDRGAVNHV